MLGFELNINGNKISAALESGVVSLISTQISIGGHNSIEIDLKGLDTSELAIDEKIDWYNTTLSEGDEFTVKVKNILKNTTPQKRENRNPDIEVKLKSYLLLKKELEDKGLI